MRLQGGGIWSLGLITTTDSTLVNADYYLTGIKGSNNFILNVWWKISKRDSLFVITNGSVTAGIYSENQIFNVQQINISNNDTVWAKHFLNFTLNTHSTDTIIVRLNGGVARSSMHMESDGLFLFDRIQLTKQ